MNPTAIGTTLILRFLMSMLIGLAITGCAVKTVQNPAAPRELLFPYGTYQHEVDLTMLQGTHSEVHFHGLVKLSADAISLVALSPMNTTLFRVREDRKTGKVEMEIYVEALQKLKPQMLDYYALIQKILTAPSEAPARADLHATRLTSGPGAGMIGEMTLATAAGSAHVELKDYDAHRVPALILVENAKFNLKIKVSGYAL